MDLPHPEGPTIATFFPAGIVNERLRKIGTQTRRSGTKSLHPKGKEALHLTGPVYPSFSAKSLHDGTGKSLSECMFRLEIEENCHV